MAGERLLRILSCLTDGLEPVPNSRRLCSVAAEVTTMDGAGILLFDGEVLQGELCSSDRVAGLLGDLHFSLGEGPGTDAHNSGAAILEPHLNDPAMSRWPAFAPPAVSAGVAAVFGFPVRLGAVRLGALYLYRLRHGPLEEEQYADATVMADVAARAILGMQAGAALDTVAEEIMAESDFHFVVHQAAGMISVQLDVTVAEALVRLRARAYADGRLVSELATDVVERSTRFDGGDSS